jgi:ketosteroid isomerase-like protein
MTKGSEQLVHGFLAALSDGDRAAVGELVHPEVEIRTERTVHRGRDAAMEWAAKTFDHLIRRYVPREIEQTDGGVLVHAELHYVWRDSDEVGDSSRVAIELGIRDGLISSWYLEDEPG